MAEHIAKLRGMETEEVAALTAANTIRLFRLPGLDPKRTEG
ncbi:hypothetical protein N752_15425 [Desulforamulus aquiferis]|nr:hypothetical protein N752_15425 [Desulforamulus aquiferis]